MALITANIDTSPVPFVTMINIAEILISYVLLHLLLLILIPALYCVRQ